MAFTEAQVKNLQAKLDGKRIKTRQANGLTLAYVEGWYVIAEANRIFGYDAWDRRTRTNNCVWTATKGEFYHAAYTAKVRVSVRAGDTMIVREGSGTGEGKALTPGQAHELALKAAETDATKRALATFGNPFGLALYDHGQTGVRKVRNGKASSPEGLNRGPWVLHSATGVAVASFDKAGEFAEALRKAMSNAHDVELLFTIWEQNVETVRALNMSLKQEALPRSGVAPQLVAHLKHCAVELGKPRNGVDDGLHAGKNNVESRRPECSARPKVDKSVLTISEPKRHRSKQHLRFVAQHACLICGRSPTHAHHLRHAQPKGLGLKVSDEFTVPLCAVHHSENHASGDERRWWQERHIDPLPVAEQLWQRTNGTPAPDNAPDAGDSQENC